jgi:hypothetical protein
MVPLRRVRAEQRVGRRRRRFRFEYTGRRGMNAGESFEAEEILGARVKYFVFTKEGYVGGRNNFINVPEKPPTSICAGCSDGEVPSVMHTQRTYHHIR